MLDNGVTEINYQSICRGLRLKYNKTIKDLRRLGDVFDEFEKNFDLVTVKKEEGNSNQ